MALNSGNGCKCPLRPLGVEAHSLLYCMVHWWVLVHLSLLAWPCKWCIMFCGTCLPQDTWAVEMCNVVALETCSCETCCMEHIYILKQFRVLFRRSMQLVRCSIVGAFWERSCKAWNCGMLNSWEYIFIWKKLTNIHFRTWYRKLMQAIGNTQT